MKLSQFTYDFSLNLVAQYPSAKREDCKLMVVDRKTGKIEHKQFKNIIDYFNYDDVFIVNNTKVFPAKINGKKEKTGAKIEVLLLRELNQSHRLWDAIVEPARKIRVGNKLYFGASDELVAEVIDNTTSRGRTIKFLWEDDDASLKSMLNQLGKTPLPAKLIKRKPDESDKENYQSVFAKVEGSVVAPFAGLHFSRDLVRKCEIKGIRFVESTLHINYYAIKIIDVEDLSKHKMISEYFKIPESTCTIVNRAKENGNRVCVVGASTMKAVESSLTAQKILKPSDSWTNYFIHPPYDFSIADSFVTNFHPPKTAFFINTCAFAGFELTMEAYKAAVKNKYRFFTYGDALLFI
ncbi:MAG: tRNA preQ1(34) S-adenosylmethionine ribosyltransferase-isomerase QueA [Phycisphaerales bacterium]|nr:tRNA preQ1(34) S-adenosylmethionine ribosyltransferase-isomerase QueA [Phycisphaerales bacterium]